MFIELTDHLRCPEDHDEAFLVLLPDRIENRSVRSGELGCPICDRRFLVRDGVLDLGDAPAPPGPESALTAEAVSALAGLSGPGGYLVLAGAAGSLWREVAMTMPGVGLVAVNPPGRVTDEAGVSVLRGCRLPLKTASMRGVVLSRPYGQDPGWLREAARAVLPGLRIVGEGPDPPPELIDLLATAAGVWVGLARR